MSQQINPEMDTLGLLKEFVKAHVDNAPDDITLESKLAEIGIDSLNLLELLFEVEEKYGVRFPNDLPQPETVGQLIEILENIRAEKVQAAASQA
jgi:acyl carrier protein